MSIRAAIFDIYDTLLEVGPAPADAAQRWEGLWRKMLDTPVPLTLAAFAAVCDRLVTRDQDAARAIGVKYPEVFWPQIVAEVRPELAALSAEARSEFVFQHAQLLHTVRLMPEAADVLKAFDHSRILLGVASNAQPYTLRELEQALKGVGLSSRLFNPALCFFSFEVGFSKPDPNFFRLLTTRLRLMGVQPAETLLIGNCPENDVVPARAQGWQIWHLTGDGENPELQTGAWGKLGGWFGEGRKESLKSQPPSPKKPDKEAV
jgi:FMN phosphatase YigB (HAD superfamily)